MKISELKQPYKRMAEYLATQNRIQEACYLIYNFYKRGSIMDLFCKEIGKGEHPPITEEIKKHFPPDFDFSGEEELSFGFAYKKSDFSREEVKTKPVMQMLDTETQKRIYTQLAKEGKFDQLPDTCEFSEAVELEVWDDKLQNKRTRLILGKFKASYLEEDLTAWNFAQLPTKKIDFSQFKTGDVVEVETKDNTFLLGYFSEEKQLSIDISYAKNERVGLYLILKELIKSITKIK